MRVAVDIGGTFTDAVAIDAAGRTRALSGTWMGSSNIPRPWVAATSLPVPGCAATSYTADTGSPSCSRVQLPPPVGEWKTPKSVAR